MTSIWGGSRWPGSEKKVETDKTYTSKPGSINRLRNHTIARLGLGEKGVSRGRISDITKAF